VSPDTTDAALSGNVDVVRREELGRLHDTDVLRDGPQRSAEPLDRGFRLEHVEDVETAADREPVIVLTVPWLERDTRRLVERLRAPVFTPPPDTVEGLGVVQRSAGVDDFWF